jgi:hypothetical protein
MFVRKKVNKSGSISVQVISKIKGKSKLIKTIGSSKNEDTIKEFVCKAIDIAKTIYQITATDKGITIKYNLILTDEQRYLAQLFQFG